MRCDKMAEDTGDIPTFGEVMKVVSAVTPYTLSSSDPMDNIMFPVVVKIVSRDFGLVKRSDEELWQLCLLANAYYVAHLKSTKASDGKQVSSESLDDHSISYAVGGTETTGWMKQYKELIRKVGRSGMTDAILRDDAVDSFYDVDTVHDEYEQL